MAGKKRLDVLLTEQGLAESRQKAQAIIMAGQVFWDGRRMDKAGASVPETAQLEIRGQTLRYVSRGGLKLEKAMQTFDLPSLEGVTAIDAGGSATIQGSCVWNVPMYGILPLKIFLNLWTLVA